MMVERELLYCAFKALLYQPPDTTVFNQVVSSSMLCFQEIEVDVPEAKGTPRKNLFLAPFRRSVDDFRA